MGTIGSWFLVRGWRSSDALRVTSAGVVSFSVRVDDCDRLLIMKTHAQIDNRSLALARAVVAVIDGDSARRGLERARCVCARWGRESPSPVVAEWQRILAGSWDSIRAVLLDVGEKGKRLRQSSPFCGILTARQRWDIYKRFAHDSRAA